MSRITKKESPKEFCEGKLEQVTYKYDPSKNAFWPFLLNDTHIFVVPYKILIATKPNSADFVSSICPE